MIFCILPPLNQGIQISSQWILLFTVHVYSVQHDQKGVETSERNFRNNNFINEDDYTQCESGIPTPIQPSFTLGNSWPSQLNSELIQTARLRKSEAISPRAPRTVETTCQVRSHIFSSTMMFEMLISSPAVFMETEGWSKELVESLR